VLWHNVLREEITALPEHIPGAYHVDVPGDDVDNTNYLTCYASEKDREQWREDFPDAIAPPHRDPLYDRDRHLPTADE